MVSSLAMAMIYEAIAFMLNDSQGLVMIGKFDLLIFAANPINMIFVAIVVAILSYLLEYTKFGYDTKSLRTGQKNAVDVGINEKRNSVFCYMIAGALMACAGVLYISQYGVIKPVVGLASSSFMMSAFLPMFIGNVLEKYSNRNIGVICGAFMQACLSSALVKFGASSSLSLVVNGACVLLLLIYVSNIYKVGLLKRNNEIKAKALASKV